MSQGKIIQIGDQHYIAGLYWVSYVGKPTHSDIVREAERLQTESGVYTVRQSEIRDGIECIQCGFSEFNMPRLPKKLESLAARVADVKIEPWLGIFEISKEEDLYWYLAVRDKQAILPDGDFIGTKEQVLAARQNHQSYDDWKYVDGDIETLKELLENQKDSTPSRVKSLRVSAEVKRARMIAITVTTMIAMAVGGGLWWYSNYQSAQKTKARIAQKQATEKQQTSELVKAKQKALAPLFNLPLPAQLLQNCRTGLYAAPISDHGWVMESFTCTAEANSIIRKRGEGATVSNLPANGVPSLDGEKTTQSLPAPSAITRTELPALLTFEEAAQVFRGWSQRAGVDLKLGSPASIMPKPAKKSNLPGAELLNAEDPEPPLPYVVATFAFSLKFSPFGLQFEVPGLFIKSVKTTGDGSYTIEGVLYGKR